MNEWRLCTVHLLISGTTEVPNPLMNPWDAVLTEPGYGTLITLTLSKSFRNAHKKLCYHLLTIKKMLIMV